MTLFGVDMHPDFQKGLDIDRVAAEGFDFLSVKVSEGLNNQWELTTPIRPGGGELLRRGKAAGLLCLAYHYLQPTDIPGQARLFAAALARCAVPGVIDAEAVKFVNGIAVPTLTIGMIRQFHTELLKLGAPIPFLYHPRWYWQKIGKPDLTGLPMLWASSYPSGDQFPASVLFQAVGPERWNSYGALPVGILQFAETGLVAGRVVDVNAFLGTRDALASLLATPVPLSAPARKETHSMEPIPATLPPQDPGTDPASWPQRNYDVFFDAAGGWEGDFAGAFGVQDWPAGKRTDEIRGYLLIASWIGSDRRLAPVDPVFTEKGGGRAVNRHNPLPPFTAPKGAVGISLNYAAPGGAGLAVGRSH